MLLGSVAICYCSLPALSDKAGCLFKCICFRLPFCAFLYLPVTTAAPTTATSTTPTTTVISRSTSPGGSGGGGQKCRCCMTNGMRTFFSTYLSFGFLLNNNHRFHLLHG